MDEILVKPVELHPDLTCLIQEAHAKDQFT